jgi:hypothetical protein
MFTKGIILNETEYRLLWGDFMEMLRERISELDREEREELLRNRKEFEEWIKDQVIEMFDFVLEDNDAEAVMIHLKDKWRYVPDGEEFYYLSYREGDIRDAMEELEEELRGDVKESRRRRLRIR